VVGALCAEGVQATSHACDPSNPAGFGYEPSRFCRLAHFPGVPDSLGSVLFVSAIFLTPVLVAVLGAAAAVATRRVAILRASAYAAGLLTLAAWLLSSILGA